MIQMKTMLNVIDNSGARIAQCIKSMRGPRKPASVGDVVVVSVQKTKMLPSTQAKQTVKKGEVRRGIIVRCRAPQRGIDGRTVKFSDNAVILVNNKGEPLGTRILSRTGTIGELINKQNSAKLAALAPQL